MNELPNDDNSTPRELGSRPGRRSFLSATALSAAGATLLGSKSASAAAPPQVAGNPKDKRLPREVWVATVSLAGLDADSPQQMTRMVMKELEEIAHQSPDIVCLPEAHTATSRNYPKYTDLDEAGCLAALEPYSDYAKRNSCYVVCPVHMVEEGKCYNSAVFIDRNGDVMGRYDKAHTTVGEMQKGVKPGTLSTPVFEADFGKIGAQICFDIRWPDGWQNLSDSGAEIVFWPSAFGGGKVVGTKAWQHQYAVVSSTWKGACRICDVDGTELAATSLWNQWAIAPINLEKAFLNTWPYVQRFDEILAKYGRKVRIQNHPEEEWSVIESRSADLVIADVLREFEIKTIREQLAEVTRLQNDNRGS